MHAVQLAVVQPPEDVLNQVSAPSEVRGVPAEEVLLPVRKQFRVIGGAPPPRDGIALKVNIDPALPGFLQQPRMRGDGISIRSGNRPLGGRQGWLRGANRRNQD